MVQNKGKYDERNRLNDLTGKEWLQHTKSFYVSKRSVQDKPAFEHPAPFLVKDIEWLIEMFTKEGMTVLDPFVGSGTTLVAANNLNRRSIGIDINPEYMKLANERVKIDNKAVCFEVGNSGEKLSDISNVDYIVTSPPYFNILSNKGSGIRKKSEHFRNGSRVSVETYTDEVKDLGNINDYSEFIESLASIMTKCFLVLNNKKYITLILSDFTINKKEHNVQGDIVKMMENIGFKFAGTVILLQNSKPLYPFGYPYAYKINHHHQNVMHFRKEE